MSNTEELPIIQIKELLQFLPSIEIEDNFKKDVYNGVILDNTHLSFNNEIEASETVKLVDTSGNPLAIIIWEGSGEKSYKYQKVLS